MLLTEAAGSAKGTTGLPADWGKEEEAVVVEQTNQRRDRVVPDSSR